MSDYMPKVCIIILNWNDEANVIECLESLYGSSYGNYELLIVDNGSRTGSIDRIKQKYRKLTIIENGRNLGYAGGNNVGIEYALKTDSDFMLLLNSDTVVETQTLKHLTDVAASDEKTGIVGAVNCCYADPDKYWYTGAKINWWNGNFSPVKQNGNFAESVDKVAGSCLLIKRELIEKIGGFDKRFFAYFEESDLCIRCRSAGFKVVLSYEGRIRHKSHDYSRHAVANYFLTRNKPLFLIKNSPKYCLLGCLLCYLYQSLLSILASLLKKERVQAYAKYLGLRDCMLGRFGQGSLEDLLQMQE